MVRSLSQKLAEKVVRRSQDQKGFEGLARRGMRTSGEMIEEKEVSYLLSQEQNFTSAFESWFRRGKEI